jgi:Uma2 family endonuclease
VEVAKRSYRIDRRYKASLYARAGLPDPWIVDLVHETVEVPRDAEATTEAMFGWRYKRVETLRRGDTVTPLIAPDVRIPVAALLP